MSPVPARIGHRYDPALDRVTLRVRPAGSALSDDFELTAGEARRLAWALLADLAPDDVDVDLERALEVVGARPASTIGKLCSCGKGDRRCPAGKSGVILRALADRRLTSAQAGALIDRPPSTASSFLVRLVADGMAERVAGGMFKDPSVYAITPAGLALAARHE